MAELSRAKKVLEIKAILRDNAPDDLEGFVNMLENEVRRLQIKEDLEKNQVMKAAIRARKNSLSKRAKQLRERFLPEHETRIEHR